MNFHFLGCGFLRHWDSELEQPVAEACLDVFGLHALRECTASTSHLEAVLHFAVIRHACGIPHPDALALDDLERRLRRGVMHESRRRLRPRVIQLRLEFAALAFLYDLRTHGGFSHHPDVTKAQAAAVNLGLPGENWHRTDYLHLLSLVAESVLRITEHLRNAGGCCTATADPK
jgi:hypothetical protein